jgi:hypothetical protein
VRPPSPSPSQLRKLMRAQGRDLHAEFVRLLPEAPRPIGVQRWSTRRVALLALVLLALIPAVPLAWAFARSSANPGGAAAVTGGNGSCTQIEELWLEAQSVPSASRIPCVQAFPAGLLRYGEAGHAGAATSARIRWPTPARGTRRPPADSSAPQRPAHSVRGEGSGRTHGRR